MGLCLIKVRSGCFTESQPPVLRHASHCSQQWWSDGCSDRLFFFLLFSPQHTPPISRWHAPMGCAHTLLFPQSREVSLLVHEPDTRRMSYPSKSTREAAKAGRVMTPPGSAAETFCIFRVIWPANAPLAVWITQTRIGQDSTACRIAATRMRFLKKFSHHVVLDLIGKCTSNSKSAYN